MFFLSRVLRVIAWHKVMKCDRIHTTLMSFVYSYSSVAVESFTPPVPHIAASLFYSELCV